MASLDSMGSIGTKIGDSLGFLKGFGITKIAIFLLLVGFVIFGFMFVRKKTKEQGKTVANITLIDDRSGTRKKVNDVVVAKKYPNGRQYFSTLKTKRIVYPYKHFTIFAGNGALDELFGYVDDNGFVHPVDFDNEHLRVEETEGKKVIKKVKSFITIPHDLSDFFIRSTEDRVEKNRVRDAWEKWQPAILLTMGIMGSLMVIIAMAMMRG